MALPKALARFNKVVTNRVLGLIAPWVPPFAVVVHVGRSSGRAYRTPVWCFHRGGRYAFALTYGSESDWVRNVVAAGGCRLLRLGRTVDLTAPRVVRARSGRGIVSAFVVVPLRVFGTHEFLLLEPGGSPRVR
jgi:deazaflavin-dependent oxidoreductase (nitroreductase family)